MKKTLASAFATLLLTAAAANQTPGPATYHVSPGGNDGNPGTREAPFATIAHAAERAKPGDTVKIGPGLYREQITFRKSGEKDAPITFLGSRGKNGEYLSVVEAPGATLDNWIPAPEIAPEAEKLPARLCRRTFEEADLNGMGLVVAATDDDALNARIAALCRERKIPVNVSTDHTLCDFYFPGVARKGELVAGVTAGGTDHRAARELTERIRELLKGE